VLEPDSTRVATTHSGPPGGLQSPHALQILTTEHWSLLAARSLVYTEAMSRASIFIASLSGAVIALALVGQATDFGTGFVAFSLVLLPVVFFLGATTVARLRQVTLEDALWMQGMNRIRNAYLELAPELEPYFVTSKHDDETGVLLSSLGMRPPVPKFQLFVGIPGVVAVIDSVVAGAIAGIAGLGLDAPLAVSLGVAGIVFLCVLLLFAVSERRAINRFVGDVVVRFPTPVDGDVA
jgi:hypothetical protein